ncbi:MAG: hypothetical protein DI533_00880 [Cereibacter sphaeroides]|uniref:Uncharacterized protein n=1 Tax=Cereibacter sphaeroides TaxID=1063 RepID=A0A2W5UN37_CERSP|nr:MAG: hypothetical protein DI533_00880 [Cereibacter sphaeroides]
MEKSRQDFSDMLDGIEISSGSGKMLGSLTTQPGQTIDFIEMFQDVQPQLKPSESFIVTLRGSDDG